MSSLEAISHGIIECVFDKCSSSAVKISRAGWERFKIHLGVAYAGYLAKSYDRYSHAKTLLYKDKPRKIREFFVVPTLKKCDKHIVAANSIKDVVDAQNHFVIIKGTGGIGKSMLMRHLFLKELEKRDLSLVPILFELRDINDQTNDYDIVEILFEKLVNFGEAIMKESMEIVLKRGSFLFLLDGYDEIESEKAIKFLKKLNNFCDKYPNNYVVVSTRPSGDFIEFKRFTVSETCGLDKAQALELIGKLDYEDKVKQLFLDALDKELYVKHVSFASNPLLLSMMFLTYDEYGDIPDKIHLFYERAFETLLIKHDRTKEGYQRKFKSGLKSDLFKKVFSHFCCLTYYSNELHFSENRLNAIFEKIMNTSEELNKFEPNDYVDDLTNNVCMLVMDGYNQYSFVHRSFQEYFTAVFLIKQTDHKAQKFGLKIIENDPLRAMKDSTFYMFYDMAKERFQKNILLPIVKEVESDYQLNSDKYDFYFKLLVGNYHHVNRALSINSGYINVFRKGFLGWFMFCLYNSVKQDQILDVVKESDKKLYAYFSREYCSLASYNRIAMEDVINVSNTSFGQKLTKLSELRKELDKNVQQEMNNDGAEDIVL